MCSGRILPAMHMGTSLTIGLSSPCLFSRPVNAKVSPLGLRPKEAANAFPMTLTLAPVSKIATTDLPLIFTTPFKGEPCFI
ncbi:hypothetical protein G6F48_013759 [Rhizopus delemar]|nr:hypothetical protein G6F48_013759 [Rhizopus delemar]